MDPVSIGLIVGLVVSGLGNLIIIARKNIRRSSCFGNTVEFKEGGTDNAPANVAPPIPSPDVRGVTWPTVPTPPPTQFNVVQM